MIAPFPPGGGVDASARIIAQALSESLGQQIVIDNRPGASARIGTELAAKAAPDGYTLLLGSVGPNAIIPSAYRNLPYDGVKDFAPVSLVATSAYVLVVHPSLPVKSVKELIALARSQPGKLDFASTGNLGGPHLCAELFKSLAAIDAGHVAFKGIPEALTEAMTGRVQFTFSPVSSVLPLARAGRVVALAVAPAKRIAVLPDVPTVAEAGIAGYSWDTWFGLLAPVKTPRAPTWSWRDQWAAIPRWGAKKVICSRGPSVASTTSTRAACLRVRRSWYCWVRHEATSPTTVSRSPSVSSSSWVRLVVSTYRRGKWRRS
jgi:tripartite-type tricarboxylate transporter receptor subunit TctC